VKNAGQLKGGRRNADPELDLKMHLEGVPGRIDDLPNKRDIQKQ